MRPEKPPAVPGANPRKASATSSTVKSSSTGWSAGGQNASDARGCRAANADWTSSGSGKLCCDKMRAALDRAPSRTARRAVCGPVRVWCHQRPRIVGACGPAGLGMQRLVDFWPSTINSDESDPLERLID